MPFSVSRIHRTLFLTVATVLTLGASPGCGGHFSGPSGPQEITLSAPVASLDSGQQTTITAAVTDFSGRALSDASVTWEISDSSLATLTPAGQTARLTAGSSGGTVTVTARAGNQTAQTQFIIQGAVLSFAKDIQPIFSRSCALAGCHSGPVDEAAEGMTLDPGVSYENIVGAEAIEVRQGVVHRIEPGQPDRSYLVAKLRGTYEQLGGEGSPMPLEGSLPAADLDKIVKWVESGAPNN
jgi:hypothetical protein